LNTLCERNANGIEQRKKKKKKKRLFRTKRKNGKDMRLDRHPDITAPLYVKPPRERTQSPSKVFVLSPFHTTLLALFTVGWFSSPPGHCCSKLRWAGWTK
jgi:hypothetical protein